MMMTYIVCSRFAHHQSSSNRPSPLLHFIRQKNNLLGDLNLQETASGDREPPGMIPCLLTSGAGHQGVGNQTLVRSRRSIIGLQRHERRVVMTLCRLCSCIFWGGRRAFGGDVGCGVDFEFARSNDLLLGGCACDLGDGCVGDGEDDLDHGCGLVVCSLVIRGGLLF